MSPCKHRSTNSEFQSHQTIQWNHNRWWDVYIHVMSSCVSCLKYRCNLFGASGASGTSGLICKYSASSQHGKIFTLKRLTTNERRNLGVSFKKVICMLCNFCALSTFLWLPFLTVFKFSPSLYVGYPLCQKYVYKISQCFFPGSGIRTKVGLLCLFPQNLGAIMLTTTPSDSSIHDVIFASKVSSTVNQQILAAIKFGVSQNKVIWRLPVYAVYDRRHLRMTNISENTQFAKYNSMPKFVDLQ